jgi:hypothetical protein
MGPGTNQPSLLSLLMPSQTHTPGGSFGHWHVSEDLTLTSGRSVTSASMAHQHPPQHRFGSSFLAASMRFDAELTSML